MPAELKNRIWNFTYKKVFWVLKRNKQKRISSKVAGHNRPTLCLRSRPHAIENQGQ